MNLRKYLPRGFLLAGAISSIGLYGCSRDRGIEEKMIEETIRGEPISLYMNQDRILGSLSTVIKTKDGKYVLCHTEDYNRMLYFSDAAALIDSEIKDGDNEPIELTGKYEGNVFNISTVSANGYRINLK